MDIPKIELNGLTVIGVEGQTNDELADAILALKQALDNTPKGTKDDFEDD